MEDGGEWEALRQRYHATFPQDSPTRATPEVLDRIRGEFPDVPPHYLDFLREMGYGPYCADGYTLFSGLTTAEEWGFTDPRVAGVAFWANSSSGCMFGFDANDGWRMVWVDVPYDRPESMDESTVAEFVAGMIGRQQAIPDESDRA
jgi:hypothetical protein